MQSLVPVVDDDDGDNYGRPSCDSRGASLGGSASEQSDSRRCWNSVAMNQDLLD